MSAVAVAWQVRHVSSVLRATAFDHGLPARGQWRNGVAVADMNGDGHLDIVHGPARKTGGGPSIFLGDGQGHWRLWSEAVFPPVDYDYGGVAVADFDADGRPDIALAVHLKKLLLLKQSAAGVFTADTRSAAEFDFSSRQLQTGDWNGDGRPDIIALSDGPLRFAKPGSNVPRSGVRVLLNLAQGFRVAALPDIDGPLFGDALALGDVNGDGKLDLAVGASRMDFRSVVRLQTDTGWQAQALAGLAAGGVVRALALRDLNRDGRADMVLAHWRRVSGVWQAAIEVFYAPDGAEVAHTYTVRTLWREDGPREITALALGNVAANRIDLAALRSDGSVLLFVGDGHAFFNYDTQISAQHAPGCRGYDAAFADVDRDGRDELVATFAGESDATGQCPQGGAIKVWKFASR